VGSARQQDPTLWVLLEARPNAIGPNTIGFCWAAGPMGLAAEPDSIS